MASIDTVNDLSARVQYVASAAQTDFDYTFPIFADANLVVDVDGVTKALSTDYTVTGAGDDTGGTVTFLVAMAGSEIVTIYRDIGIERSTDFQQNGPYSSSSFNDELDRITLVQQELEMKLGNALRVPLTAEVDSDDIELTVANFANKYLTFDADGKPTPAVLADATMTQASIGTLYRPRSAAEIAAGVTPTDYYYDWGDVRRYGAVGDGVTDDTTAIQNAISVGSRGGHGVFGFDRTKTYLVSNLTLYSSTNTIPAWFDASQAILKAKAATSGYLVDIITPQGSGRHGFEFRNVIIDGNDICVPLRIYGSQRAKYSNILVYNSSAEGVRFEHESGGNGGIYYNLFHNIVSGQSGSANAGDGFYSDANSSPAYTMQDNTFINCQAQFCAGDGWDLQYGSGAWIGCGAEKCDGQGVKLTNMIEATWVGGFTENNNKGRSGGGASDGTTDVSFELSTGCNGVKVLGGRHIGEFTGSGMFQVGNVLLPGNYVQFPNLILDERERLRVRTVLPNSRSFTISSTTKGSPTTITLSANHNLATGDYVRFNFSIADDWQTNLDDLSRTITVTGETTFTVTDDSTSWADYTTGGTCKNGGGIGLDSASAPQGGINGPEGWELQAAGSAALTLQATCASGETSIYIRHNADGGGAVLERVTAGAVDSGGTGYRLLRIPN